MAIVQSIVQNIVSSIAIPIVAEDAGGGAPDGRLITSGGDDFLTSGGEYFILGT